MVINPRQESSFEEVVDVFLQRLETSRRAVALTGAGISTAAGLPDFRGPKGLYTMNPERAQRIFDLNAFLVDPRPFYDLMREWSDRLPELKPTPAHRFLADLEKRGRLAGIVTQNIDDLHHMAGSQNVIHLHGSLGRFHCQTCRHTMSLTDILSCLRRQDIPTCPRCGGVMRPDIVFFNEPVRDWSAAVQLVERSDCLIIVGSRCQVHPAASLPAFCHHEVWVINNEPVDPPRVYQLKQVNTDIQRFFQACRMRRRPSARPFS